MDVDLCGMYKSEKYVTTDMRQFTSFALQQATRFGLHKFACPAAETSLITFGRWTAVMIFPHGPCSSRHYWDFRCDSKFSSKPTSVTLSANNARLISSLLFTSILRVCKALFAFRGVSATV